MKVVEESPEKLILRAEISESLANAIRRSISEIQTLAFDEVEIFKNDSALYDEVLAHRIGLIPIKTEKSMKPDKTSIDFKLAKKGPGLAYAEDLSGSAEIVFPKIPITLLGENHKLELIATANFGSGLDHAKYIPGICYYRHVLEVKSSKDIDALVEKAPSMIKPEKKGSKWICDLPEATIDDIKAIDEEAISDTSELLIFIESFGHLTSKEILTKSIEALSSNLDEFEKSIK